MENILKINNLSVSFNIENKVSSAVKNISLDVAKGEALGFVGAVSYTHLTLPTNA